MNIRFYITTAYWSAEVQAANDELIKEAMGGTFGEDAENNPEYPSADHRPIAKLSCGCRPSFNNSLIGSTTLRFHVIRNICKPHFVALYKLYDVGMIRDLMTV